MDIGLIIRQLRKEKNYTQKSFSDKLSIDNSQMSKIEQGKLQPTLNQVMEISSILETTTDWLLTGKAKDNATPLINKEFKGVPYYDVDFIGGFDLVMNDQSMKPSFYIDFSPFNSADYWVNITGKSMSPFISHGDLVALQEFDGWQDFVLFGEIYAIVTDHFRTIKIVGKGEDKDHLSLIPYSKSTEFSKQDIPKKLIKHMFKVKGSIKKFF